MVIKQSSWHYKAMDFFDIDHSKSLCLYFWQVALWLPLKAAFFLVVCLFFAGVAFVLLSSALAPIITPIFFPEAMFSTSEDLTGWADYFNVAFVIGCMGWSVAAMLGICKLIHMGCRWIAGRPIKKASEPTLFGEYIKTKKEKICPTIRFDPR